jgi:enhancer of mRNA-decapping protein 4
LQSRDVTAALNCISFQTILGCVDEFGNLFVFSISENPSDSSLRHELLLEVTADPDEAISDYHRIIWCPYLPDDEDEEDEDDPDSPSRQLVVTRGRVAEIWNLDMVVTAHGTKVSRAQYKKQSDGITGRLVIDDHEAAITDAAFSPDGTAIATSSLDGRVKFFQCYLAGASESSPPRCLHKWSPHDGRPVSCLFFLDDHKVHDPAVQFWKYAVTGADNNSELKVWSCETWTCLQTVRFQQPEAAGGGQKRLALKAAMDLAANFLILSDIYRKRVYALHFKQVSILFSP